MKLLILPGVNSGAYLFDKASAALGRKIEVLALNPPGVGKPPLLALTLPFSAKAYAREVLRFLERKKITRVAVLGHSLGGYAAQELARMAPALVEKLILVSTGPGQPYTTRDMSAMPGKTGKSFWEMAQTIDKNPHEGMKPMFGKNYLAQHPHDYEAFIAARTAHLAGQVVSMAHLGAGGAFSSVRWARKLEVPALVIHGSDDVLISAASGRELASLLPQAQYIELHGVRHFPMLEHPEFWRYVKGFLEGQGSGRKVEPRRHEGFWSKLKEVLTRHG